MKKGVVISLVLVFLLTACAAEKPAEKTIVQQETKEQTPKIQTEVKSMRLTSNDFKEGESIPAKFTCRGENINPHLAWDDVPEGVKSFALIVDDPDAPSGLWTHWLVKDIPSDVREIKQNSVPGNQVANDFGKEDYGGPCPPSGTHRYLFKLYALNVEKLDVDNKGDFYEQVEKNAIVEAELMGKYEKT